MEWQRLRMLPFHHKAERFVATAVHYSTTASFLVG